LLGETPGSEGGVTFFDPRANVRLSISASSLSYTRRFPPPAARRLAAVGQAPDTLVVVGVSAAKGECAVAVEARPLNRARARWRWPLPGPCWAIAIATDRERVFVHAGPSVHALALATGKEIWRVPSPCAADSCIAELAADEREIALAVGGKALTVYSAESGAVIRQLAIDDLGEPRALRLRDQRACLASSSRRRLPDTTVMCVGLDGQHRWTQTVGGDLNGLELEHDVVYVAAGGTIRALAAVSGENRWTFGGDRVSLARLSDGVRVVLGTDGAGALILPEGAPPEPMRELTVAGVVKVTSPPQLAAPPLITAVAFQVAGTTVPLARDGSYRVRVRLNGGRVKLVACGCKECSGAEYIALDDRTTYQKDVTFQDTCID
jgi:outer membrane protein assembly factor BamB